ncbi:MAG TPA: hypothetical protein ENN23_07350 [Deltaproteobacteria bacterium]|nr:hypothetical protein [Deltaproteobacteria bacterium]
MTKIKSIDTIYKDFRFRSRLEARWAVFFDELGIFWEYEKEGYEVNGIRYLPDFWLSQFDCWIEIKGDTPGYFEKLKAINLCLALEKDVHIFVGEPYMAESYSSFGFSRHYLPPEQISEMLKDPKEYAVDTFSEKGFVSDAAPMYFWVENSKVALKQRQVSKEEWLAFHVVPQNLKDAYVTARQARFEFEE